MILCLKTILIISPAAINPMPIQYLSSRFKTLFFENIFIEPPIPSSPKGTALPTATA